MPKRLLSWLLVLALLVGICVTALADASPEPDGGGGGTPCNHIYSIIMSSKTTTYTAYNSSYHYKAVTQYRKCVYCGAVANVQIESPVLEPHSWVTLSKELVGSNYVITKECSRCHKSITSYAD